MNMKYQHHLVFVAPETTPNLTPILDSRLQPETVWLIYTPNFINQAQKLQNFYQQHQVKSHLIPIDSAFELSAIKAGFKEVTKHLPDLNQLAINISCGTKMMSIAATEHFLKTPAHIFYIQPNDDLIWLKSEHPTINLQDNLSLHDFLQTHGGFSMRLTQFSADEQHINKKVLEQIEQHIIQKGEYDTFNKFIHELLIHKGKFSNNRKIKPLMQALQKVSPQIDLNKRYMDYQAAPHLISLLKGLWFEVYAYQALKSLQKEMPQIQDIQMNCKITNEQDVADEVDVLFLVNNKLYIIECKTGTKQNINHQLQRLDSLSRKLGGALSYSCYLTTLPLSPQSGYLNKAQNLNVHLLHKPHIPNLKHQLKQWIQSTSPN
jgi:hypothetical protein